jgi:cytochrome c oxidase subunit I+III
VDARPIQCQRLPGNSFVPFAAAVALGGFFVFGSFHFWKLAAASLPVAIGLFLYWLWTGTAEHPEKEHKDVGLGLKLPLYVSGSDSVGWWGMFITMLADLTAFVCIVFGYFFFWTVRDDFPPEPSPGPGVLWPAVGGALLLASWALTEISRRANRRGATPVFYAALGWAVLLAIAGSLALLAGPWLHGLDPKSHSYPATVWLLVAWTVLHVALGVVMQLYCLARRAAGRLTPRYDMDAANVALYWHFVAVTVFVTVATIAGFPLVA